MDPIWTFAQRNHNYTRGLIYDASYWFHQTQGLPEIQAVGVEKDAFYASRELYDYYVTLKKNFVLPEGSLGEILIYDRGHPLGSIPRILSGNLDARTIELVFGIQNPQIKVHVASYPFQMAIMEELSRRTFSAEGKPVETANYFIMAVEGMLTSLECQHLFILSLNFERITLFQPAVSNNRYLIAIGFKPQMTRDNLLDFSDAGLGVRSRVEVPEAFERWLTNINNTYLGSNAEILIHLTEAKNAFNRQGMSYWPEMSYDVKRVKNLFQGRRFLPHVIEARDFQKFREDEITDEHIRYSMHLWNSPELGEFEAVPGSERELEPRTKPKLHMYLDFEKDGKRDYDPKVQNVSGDNWGQRKLLITEIQFLTEYADPSRPAVVFYVGSAPFDHGPFLFKYFENIKFILIDPRPMNPGVLKYQRDQVMIIQKFFNEDLAEQIVAALLSNTQAKDFNTKEFRQIVHPGLVKSGEIDYLYISDIRTDVTNVSADLHEKMIEKDMILQSRGLDILAKLRRPQDAAGAGLVAVDPLAGDFKNSFVASVKFRHSYDMTDPYFEYEQGILATQPWAPLNSTELRLWTIPGSDKIKYDKLQIERIMAHHNVVIRQQRFDDPGIEGYDECHDCHVELEILDKFARRVRGVQTDDEVYDELIRIGNAIKDTLGGLTLKEHVERKAKPRIHVLKGINGAALFDPFIEYHRALAFTSVKRYFSREVEKFGRVQDKRLVNLSFKQFMFYLANVRRIETDVAAGSGYSDSQLINWKQIKLDPLAISPEEALHQILAENGLNLTRSNVGKILANVNYSRELSMLRSLDSKGVSMDVEYSYGKNEKVSFTYMAPGPLPQYVMLKKPKPTKGNPAPKEEEAERIPKIRSLKVKQKFLFKLFTRKENSSSFDVGQLLHIKPFLDRAFCILTRYKNVHFEGMCDAPKELIEKIRPDYICGTNILSSDDNYGAIYTDFELQYTPFNNPFTHETFAAKFQKVLVFPPNIKPLIISYIRKWIDILKKTEILAVIFVIPVEYKIFLEEGEIPITEHVFNRNIYDHCDMKEVEGDERTIYVLKTEKSGFAWI